MSKTKAFRLLIALCFLALTVLQSFHMSRFFNLTMLGDIALLPGLALTFLGVLLAARWLTITGSTVNMMASFMMLGILAVQAVMILQSGYPIPQRIITEAVKGGLFFLTWVFLFVGSINLKRTKVMGFLALFFAAARLVYTIMTTSITSMNGGRAYAEAILLIPLTLLIGICPRAFARKRAH